jgi:A/G-specific adenine glycosylase
MSLAYDLPEPIMDGNVKRVFARHFLVAGEPNKSRTLKQLWQLAEAHKEPH